MVKRPEDPLFWPFVFLNGCDSEILRNIPLLFSSDAINRVPTANW